MPNLLHVSQASSLALHTMVVLAGPSEPRLTDQEMAEALHASSHHLAKVMQRLAKAGLVDSVRGPLGTFRLGKSADRIRLLDIVEAVDGPLAQRACLLEEPICDGEDCLLGDILQSMHQRMRDYLGKTTLAQLADGEALRKRGFNIDMNPKSEDEA